MRVQTSVHPRALAQDDAVVPGVLLEAVVRAVTQAICAYRPLELAPPAGEDGRPDLPPLLAPQQAADLMGVSRNTVDRMVEDGDLPSVPLRQGSRQRMVRIPKAFVLAMLAELNAGKSITSLKGYTAAWQATAAVQPAAAAVPEPAGAA